MQKVLVPPFLKGGKPLNGGYFLYQRGELPHTPPRVFTLGTRYGFQGLLSEIKPNQKVLAPPFLKGGKPLNGKVF